MEIIKNRYNQERVIETISTSKLRIMGDSLVYREQKNSDGTLKMFDFEGGPTLSIGGKIKYLSSEWLVKSIKLEDSDKENFYSIVAEVELQY
jgi:hypothetical protein